MIGMYVRWERTFCIGVDNLIHINIIMSLEHPRTNQKEGYIRRILGTTCSCGALQEGGSNMIALSHALSSTVHSKQVANSDVSYIEMVITLFHCIPYASHSYIFHS